MLKYSTEAAKQCERLGWIDTFFLSLDSNFISSTKDESLNIKSLQWHSHESDDTHTHSHTHKNDMNYNDYTFTKTTLEKKESL